MPAGPAPPLATRSVKQSALPGGSWRTAAEEALAAVRRGQQTAGLAHHDDRAAAEQRGGGQVLLDGLEDARPPLGAGAAPASPSPASSTLTRQVSMASPGSASRAAQSRAARSMPKASSPQKYASGGGPLTGRRVLRAPRLPAPATMPLRPEGVADPGQALDAFGGTPMALAERRLRGGVPA